MYNNKKHGQEYCPQGIVINITKKLAVSTKITHIVKDMLVDYSQADLVRFGQVPRKNWPAIIDSMGSQSKLLKRYEVNKKFFSL